MATLSHTESRRLYSWWWDSHMSPKNSKWLKENLEDMDSKVKAMIRIIEEDAESFAKRAEMFYKRRPELMNLVEELYRGYRALAERYDHANGALRQAHQTMAEAFPDQIPFELDDEISSTSVYESDLHNLDMPDPLISALLGPTDLRKDTKVGEEALQKEISRLLLENQDLKSQIASQSKRGDEAESAVLGLKETLSESEAENEIVLSNLKAELCQTQEELKKLKDEVQTAVNSLSNAGERSLMLEKENQSLQTKVHELKQEQQEEHNEKQAELEKLRISIQEEHLQRMQAEMACLTLAKMLEESQEKLRNLVLEIQGEVGRLKDMETNEVRVEEEIKKIREENRMLNDENRSSTDRIIDLQDQIIFLKDVRGKLEDKVSLHVEEKKVLQKEISRLKEDKADLERRHSFITKQIEDVNSNVESLQKLVQELRDGNMKLKYIIKNHEDLEVHVEILKHLEMSEKNVILINSLSVANTELEVLRKQKKTLEDSCVYLHSKISTHQSERVLLVSKIETISQNMEKMSAQNIFLDNSLCDTNVELEGLREKLKDLEESCQHLCDRNSVLLYEKESLVSKVESISKTLENLESKYEELEGKYLNLEREKDLTFHQVTEVQELMRQEREECKNLVHSSKGQLSALEKQICLLQEGGRRREEYLEVEQQKIINAQIEVFILQRCLCDMKENNLILSVELQKHQEKSMCAEKQNLELTGKLTNWISLILKVLNLDHKYGSLDGMKDDLALQLILHEISYLLNRVSDAQDVKQNHILEKSIVTLLQHYGQEVADLRSEKNILKQEFQTKTKEMSLLLSEKQELLKINEQFSQENQASYEKVAEVQDEMKLLVDRLSDLQESRSSLQSEITKLQEDNSSLSSTLHDIREKEKSLKEEYFVILEEATTMEHFNGILKSVCYEKALNLLSLCNEFDSLHESMNKIYQELRLMNEKIDALQVENNHLKTSVGSMNNCNSAKFEGDLNAEQGMSDQLNGQINTEEGSVTLKHRDVSQANQMIRQAQFVNLELRRNLEGVKVVREELEKNITNLSENSGNIETEISSLHKENKMLREELHNLQGELEELRGKRKNLTFEQQKGMEVVESCTAEISTLLSNIQFATINAALFREKVLELIMTCENFEISAMVERQVLKEEATRRNLYVDVLKEKLSAIKVQNRRLKVDKNGDFTLLGSSQNNAADLSGQTVALKKGLLSSNKLENEVNILTSFQLFNYSDKLSEYHNAITPARNLELQQLFATIKALKKMAMDTGIHLEHEILDFSSTLSAAQKQIEMLKLKEILHDDFDEVNYKQMLKDIQLDLIQNSSESSNSGFSFEEGKKGNSDEPNDQMLESWRIVGQDGDSYTQESPEVSMLHNIEHVEIDTMEISKGRLSCDLLSEKELCVDRQELSKKVGIETRHEWNKRVIERLSSDTQRLLVLQASIQELKTNIESSEEHSSTSCFELDNVEGKLKEAEGTIFELIDTNKKLIKNAEDLTASPDNLSGENLSLSSRNQRKILERARKMSEKIGRLELELQKIQDILLKLEEEHANKRTKTAPRKSKVLLVDYLYGRRGSRRPNKTPCGCLRLTPEED
ncbi:protein NETWORKED 1D-like isoform X2 [Typha latifolia]|uniref:protein NETWORKED 1D-like isoform X2 n=1 Tax=Typha latifolia TaxID=4733 RepID=UPI003C2CB82C